MNAQAFTFGSHAVPATAEFRRIDALPRRQLPELDCEAISAALRAPGGTRVLRLPQAQALYEAHQARGLFLVLRVGGGKTDVSLLLPRVLQATRPVLLLPAKLVDKTRRDQLMLARQWHLPRHVRIMTYNSLGCVAHKDALEAYRPDLIIADECHKLKNRRAAVTRRVARYIEAHPETVFCAMSGTITKRSLRDYAHILWWCFRERSPLPVTWTDLEDWANALDEKLLPGARVHPGALLKWAPEGELLETIAARKGFARRLAETPGVVMPEEETFGVSLSIDTVGPAPCSAIEAAFERLRTRWELPDGQQLIDALSVARAARQLALGFFYRWKYPAPKPWLEARAAWAKFCRDACKRENVDSEKDVALHHPDAPEYLAWSAIRDTFTPETEAVWISGTVLQAARAWLTHAPGIAWVEHVEFGEALARISGLPYYGAEGCCTRTGRSIEICPGGSIIASIDSNAEGRNLQDRWHRNLVLGWRKSGLQTEQLLGRTHRDGQRADEVTFEVYVGCLEHLAALHQSYADAGYIENTTRQPQKMRYADFELPKLQREGWQWNKL